MSNCPASLIQRCFIPAIGATIAGLVAGSQGAIAQVSADSGSNTSVSFGSNTWTIGLGTQRANSLFHNLINFKILEGELVDFKVDSGSYSNVDRVVAYIKNAAEINGNIRIVDQLLQPKPADLILLSPNGISFGTSAYLDVRGALFATTANKLTFDDGVVFEDGRVSIASGLLTHKPIKFGFGLTPGTIRAATETTPIGDNAANLNLGPNLTALAFLGNNIELKNRGILAPSDGLYLGAVQGNTTIQLGARSAPGDRLDFIYPTRFDQLGLIQLTHRSSLQSLNTGGDIEVTAKDINMTDYFIVEGLYKGGYIASENGDVTFLGQNIKIEASGIYYNNRNLTFTSGNIDQGQLILDFSGVNKITQEGIGKLQLLSQSIDLNRFGMSPKGGEISIVAETVDLSKFFIDSEGGLISINATRKVSADDFLVKVGSNAIDINSPLIDIDHGKVEGTANISGDSVLLEVVDFQAGNGFVNISGTDNLSVYKSTFSSQNGTVQLSGDVISIVGGLPDRAGPDIENPDPTPRISADNISILAGNKLDIKDEFLIASTGGDILLEGNKLSLSGTVINNSTGNTTLMGDLLRLQDSAISNTSGSINLDGGTIDLDSTSIDSNGAGSLYLSGESLALNGSQITKNSPVNGVLPVFFIEFQNSIVLDGGSTVSARNFVTVSLDAERINIADDPNSKISVFAPTKYSLSERLSASGFGFNCSSDGSCSFGKLMLPNIPEPNIPDIPEPNIPEPNIPEPTAKVATQSELPSPPIEPTSSPKVAAIPLSARDSSSQNALNLRCQGPIARQVLLQRSGRGGLLSTPGATVAADVFQDFGGLTPRSTPPIASAPTATTTALEAQNWQVDPQGRISLLASVAVTNDRASQKCPDLSTQ
jgi:filamentous hemagglutinin family protein